MPIPAKLVISNPKRGSSPPFGRDQWFPYYAGFSSEFAQNIVSSSSLETGATIMDPWNGSGTTTFCAVRNGYNAIGFDLNPSMAVVAKAKLLPQSEINSVIPLLADILGKVTKDKSSWAEEEPLQAWFTPESALAIRRIERSIYGLLVPPQHGCAIDAIPDMSCLAAFFYVALFRAVRLLLQRFQASNPTWIRRPAMSSRNRTSVTRVKEAFAAQVTAMASGALADFRGSAEHARAFSISVASSHRLPLESASVDFVLSSPPYCTRIDYGIATLPELAIMGFEIQTGLREFRAALIGTPTIQRKTPEPKIWWGPTCTRLLDHIWRHRSKAARTYYYKTYTQYFDAMASSVVEVSRCLKKNAPCVLVAQDSYFKELHVDLARILAEMGHSSSLSLRRQVDFPIRRTFGSINPTSRKYRAMSSATESVLCFVKK